MKKIVIFLPDGVGLRNFIFGNFNKILPYLNISFTYWNNTKYPINSKTGFNEIKISNPKNHFLSDLIKRAKSEIELKLSFKKSENGAIRN